MRDEKINLILKIEKRPRMFCAIMVRKKWVALKKKGDFIKCQLRSLLDYNFLFIIIMALRTLSPNDFIINLTIIFSFSYSAQSRRFARNVKCVPARNQTHWNFIDQTRKNRSVEKKKWVENRHSFTIWLVRRAQTASLAVVSCTLCAAFERYGEKGKTVTTTTFNKNIFE